MFASQACLLQKRACDTSVFALKTLPRRLASSMGDAEQETLYRAVGDRIRTARERQPKKVSQVALASKLGVSRASIVNIEAGRQHAPLSLLWQIAQQLDTELIALIPRKAELDASPPEAELSGEMRKQIRLKADGDASLEKDLTTFISQAVRQLTSSPDNANRPKRKK